MDNHNTSSILSQKENQLEEESLNSNRLPRTSRRSSRKNIATEHFNSSDIPIKSSGKSIIVITIEENRKREKRELNHLNDRFASYIERVRFLEGQNKTIQLEINQLREKLNSRITKVKEKYENKISEVRQTIDNTVKDHATVYLRAKHAEENTLKFKDKCDSLLAVRDSDRKQIEFLQKQLFDNEADLNLIHRRLTDLEDEQKRCHIESKQLLLDIQRIKNDLNDEIISRIQLENQKENLEKELEFLKDIHLHEIEELKQINLNNTSTLNPTKFFQYELSNAIKNIRQEYEQLNFQQRHELESWYQSKVTQAIKEVQASEKPKKNILEQEEIQRLRTLVSNSQQDITTIHQRNEELENRTRELEDLIKIERNENIRASNERNQKLKELKDRLVDLARNYDELISMKISLDSEISIYRKLLEGEENREGLKRIAENVEHQIQANFPATSGESITYSQSYPRKNDSQENQVRSYADRENTLNQETPYLSPISSSSNNNNIQNNDEPIQTPMHEEFVQLQNLNASSERNSDYDSSKEDSHEQHDHL
ncbi:unnamed protein product [Rotaria sordida]|uniref:IF rod domain-containing protein n=1 Tax=Rotaria sordida TaxID=392033 RepID=A0A818SLM9_9BILA|nr:unnamed protein product [Rotaria sordida]CAF1306453.1 unnamed protein product [Rotaria sordida]CAF3674495.1 unnamed protein product [Rotaria sordida]CAF3729386.1 unnamed protein product [Rotaria sordida]